MHRLKVPKSLPYWRAAGLVRPRADTKTSPISSSDLMSGITAFKRSFGCVLFEESDLIQLIAL